MLPPTSSRSSDPDLSSRVLPFFAAREQSFAYSNGRSLDNAERSRNPACEVPSVCVCVRARLALCNTSVGPSPAIYLPARSRLFVFVAEKFRPCVFIYCCT